MGIDVILQSYANFHCDSNFLVPNNSPIQTGTEGTVVVINIPARTAAVQVVLLF